MKIHPHSFLLFVFGLSVFLSCQSHESSENVETYHLAKVDSIQVDNFTRVSILDFSEKENKYLGYSQVDDLILEISTSGEILKRISRKGDGPNNYGNWNPIGLAFGPNHERIVELPFQVIAYDSAFTIQNAHRIMSPLPIRTNTPLGKTPYFESQDSLQLLVGPSNYLTASYLIRNQEGKDTLQNFYQLNLQSGKTKTVLPYDENSVYEKTENLYSGLMGKTFFIDHEKNELVLVQELDPEILIYQLPDLSLIKRIPIQYSEFLTHSPLPIDTPFDNPQLINLSRLSGRNRKLIHLDKDLILLQYFTGITEAEFESRNSEVSPYSGVQDASEQRILIFKEGKLLPMELPGIEGNIITSLPGNRILVQELENQEKEEEFTRFLIYQLQTN